MRVLISFIVCVAMALVNLPFVLQEGGSTINLCAMIFCGASALWPLFMLIKTTR
jgi:hypothetical protein